MNLDYSFPKSQHLRRSKDIRWLIKSGRKYVSSSMILYVIKTADQTLKAGFIVSKRVGQAVLRNRVKRLMREAFRTQKHLFGEQRWLVFLARSGVKEWKHSTIFDEMTQLAQKIKS
jgi:ribonuclease P protein component